jgi:mRNA interferase HigB
MNDKPISGNVCMVAPFGFPTASSAAEVKRSDATASIVSADRIDFNIKGNDYRLVVAVDFEKSIVWTKWIGTHKEYDKIIVKEVQHDG